jgi:hypothetical protein
MKLNYRLIALSTVLVSAFGAGSFLAACGGGGDNKDGGGTDAAKEGGGKDAGNKDAGGGGDAADDAPAVPLLNPLCTAPVDAATNGSCVTIDGTNFTCNPVNNQGCDGGAGETCDFSDQGFVCFPAPNDVPLCGNCDNMNGPFCKPTMHCVEEDGGGTGCGRWCCDDTDCTGGHCDTTYLGQAPGICVK